MRTNKKNTEDRAKKHALFMTTATAMIDIMPEGERKEFARQVVADIEAYEKLSIKIDGYHADLEALFNRTKKHDATKWFNT